VRIDVRRRLDAGRIDGLHLLGVSEDVGELFREQLFLVVGQLEIGEPGDALDVCDGECGHNAMLIRSKVKGQKAKVKGQVKGSGPRRRIESWHRSGGRRSPGRGIRITLRGLSRRWTVISNGLG